MAIYLLESQKAWQQREINELSQQEKISYTLLFIRGILEFKAYMSAPRFHFITNEAKWQLFNARIYRIVHAKGEAIESQELPECLLVSIINWNAKETSTEAPTLLQITEPETYHLSWRGISIIACIHSSLRDHLVEHIWYVSLLPEETNKQTNKTQIIGRPILRNLILLKNKFIWVVSNRSMWFSPDVSWCDVIFRMHWYFYLVFCKD